MQKIKWNGIRYRGIDSKLLEKGEWIFILLHGENQIQKQFNFIDDVSLHIISKHINIINYKKIKSIRRLTQEEIAKIELLTKECKVCIYWKKVDYLQSLDGYCEYKNVFTPYNRICVDCIKQDVDTLL